MSWDYVSLEEAPLDILDGDRGNNYPKQDEFFEQEHCLFLSATNVTKTGFEFQECQFITEQKDGQLRKGKLKRNDIVITTRGTIGNVAHYNDGVPFENIRINSGMVIVRTDDEKLFAPFLYSYFRSSGFFKQVNQLRSGVAQPQLPIRDMKLVEIPLPKIDEQKRIAIFIGNYDDLIENNRRRIQLLEESARLLYKEWFVQLRFPGHEHVKTIDGMPEGWDKKKLDKLCYQVKVSVDPSEVEVDTPYIGLEHIPRRSITLSEWETAEKVTSGKYSYQESDIIFGKIRPYFHKVGFALTSGITSSDAIVIRPHEAEHYAYLLMLISSDLFVALASKTVKEGSKMPRADWTFLSQQYFLIPSGSLLEVFQEQIEAIVKQLKVLAFQNKQLTQARDILLPRLMNGALAV